MKLLSDPLRQRLREKRLRMGLRQDHLAHEIGVSSVRLCNLEAGKQQPSIGTLARWCDCLGLALSIDARNKKSRPPSTL